MWYANRDLVEKTLMKAMDDGTIRRGTAQRLTREARGWTQLGESRNITIRMPVSVDDRARALAEKKGVGYQTYMKMLLHEALDREARRAR